MSVQAWKSATLAVLLPAGLAACANPNQATTIELARPNGQPVTNSTGAPVVVGYSKGTGFFEQGGQAYFARPVTLAECQQVVTVTEKTTYDHTVVPVRADPRYYGERTTTVARPDCIAGAEVKTVVANPSIMMQTAPVIGAVVTAGGEIGASAVFKPPAANVNVGGGSGGAVGDVNATGGASSSTSNSSSKVGNVSAKTGDVWMQQNNNQQVKQSNWQQQNNNMENTTKIQPPARPEYGGHKGGHHEGHGMQPGW